MEGRETEHRLWAVLIGVDYYESKPLQGAVRDVKILEEYLKASYGSTDIQILTASKSRQEMVSLYPEAQGALPTRKNVISKMVRIVSEAQAGDSVHIHFSGHGTTTVALSEYSNKDSGDLGLVLYEDHGHETNILRGLDLVYHLKGMVDKKLVVTVVLDCCFSGSVVLKGERDVTIRTTSYSSKTVVPSRDRIYSLASSPEILRDAGAPKKSLLNPEGYAIITACNPYEESGERKFNGNFHGALSFMLDISLRSHSRNTTFYSLYENVRSQFDSNYPQQTPMFFGNRALPFFGKLLFKPDVFSVCVFTRDGRLYLEAGAAHGLQVEDEYHVYPPSFSEASVSLDKASRLIAKVIDVRGINSSLEIIAPNSEASQIRTGWRAKPFRRCGSGRIPVRINIGDHDASQGMITAEEDQLWSNSRLNQKEPICKFSVEHSQDRYEFFDDSHRRIIQIPPILRHEERMLAKVKEKIEHFATFKFLEQIRNREPCKTFEDLFEVNLQDQQRRSFGDSNFTNIDGAQTLFLTTQNLGDQVLYLSILNLGAQYQIQEPRPEGVFIPVKGKSLLKLAVNMTIPENHGLQSCEDILKVFITSRPTLFTQFWLPPINESTKAFEDENGEISERYKERLSLTNRGIREQEYDPLAADWTALNFRIQCHVKSLGQL